MFSPRDAENEAAVLAANARFYSAFSAGDRTAMGKLWAERARVTCLHPGMPPLIGREAVLESWRQILRDPPPFRLRCDQVSINVLGEVAVVTCYEGGGEDPAHLAATNVFALEDGAWRMVHHHAGPLSSEGPRPRAVSQAN